MSGQCPCQQTEPKTVHLPYFLKVKDGGVCIYDSADCDKPFAWWTPLRGYATCNNHICLGDPTKALLCIECAKLFIASLNP